MIILAKYGQTDPHLDKYRKTYGTADVVVVVPDIAIGAIHYNLRLLL